MIDVLERITYYQKKKGWTEYQLAEEAGMTQSTISSWYRKNIVPSVPSLEKICGAFNITLSQFFATEDETGSLTDNQKQLVKAITRLSEPQQTTLIAFIESL